MNCDVLSLCILHEVQTCAGVKQCSLNPDAFLEMKSIFDILHFTFISVGINSRTIFMKINNHFVCIHKEITIIPILALKISKVKALEM